MPEMWKAIPGFENYEISNTGLIRSIKIMSTYEKGGFVRTDLYANDGKRHSVMIHHLVAHAFVEKPPETVCQVRHWDGDKRNNTPSNLYWVTGAIKKLIKLNYGKKPMTTIPDYR